MNFSNKEVEHIIDGNVEYLKFRALKDYESKIKHCITLRHGGVSRGVYSSLNFRRTGTIFSDDEKNILENVSTICKKVGIKKVYKATQKHTDKILRITTENKEKYIFENNNKEEYDAYICNIKNIATLITTADCVPIIIYDPVNNVYANIHSGWRGTVKNISKLTAIKMKEDFNLKYEDMIVCIGPSIRKCCFTSKDENFKNEFVKVFNYEEEYLNYDVECEKLFHIDLQYIIKKELIELGIKEKNIHDANICTCCNNLDFFSCRASKKDDLVDFGTFATIVEIV